MSADRLDPERVGAMTEGAIWDKRRHGQNNSVKILRIVRSRIGLRLLVRGLKTGREWAVNPDTLLSSYDPHGGKPSSRQVNELLDERNELAGSQPR